MFSGSISCSQRRPSQTHNAADGHNSPGALLHHMRQHLLGDGDCAEEVKLHQSLIHIHAGVCAQRALASTAIVDEDINLRNLCENAINGGQWLISLVTILFLLLNRVHEPAVERLTRPKCSMAALVFSTCDDLSNKSSGRTKMFSS